MENYLEFIIPIIALTLLTAGWMAIQLIAKKIGTKNHITHGGSCCGACENRDSCSKI